MIICASRRTDIPAFHSEWFMNRLYSGYAMVRNPVARDTVYRVDLDRKNVDCIVFITKDPRPMMHRLDEIDGLGYPYLFQISVTPYGRDIEPRVPSKADITESFRTVSDRIGKDRIAWRYDPIIINDRLDTGYHSRKFRTLCEELGGYTDRCIFSFVDIREKLKMHSDILKPISEEEKIGLVGILSDISADYGIKLSSCCSELDYPYRNVDREGCIDGRTFSRLGIPFGEVSAPLRKNCRCVRNIDIGGYDTCGHDCIYCYANRNTGSERNDRVYRTDSEILSGSVTEQDRIIELSSRSVLKITDF